ncbi:ribonuclease III [Desulfoscipio geothermicus]|uniref:Ribonuclease 3 n=1 Tax=Desulfoscipio geothermicus DSM 3669 TaxID=1121426 RepID=A0A1I6D746_9FIRM|nr:ribonuclease III [Desulfoscipio geothermicus]SFR01147.1 RNAse III [Desulfoscipio geothermicus DSM 3669]
MERFENGLTELQKRLHYTWRNPELLRQALVHSSYTYENKGREHYNNERLEYLGDAVLELVISDYFYHSFPEKTEGELTKMRALTVCEPSLALVARRLELGRYLLMGRGEERSGGRDRPSLLADAFEALLGSVYLDAGLEEARRVALQELAGILEKIKTGQTARDYKTDLQEVLQRKSTDPIHYHIINEAGPDHDKVFTAAVEHRGKKMGWGRGKSKKEAEQQAAKMALEKYLQSD